MTDTSHKLALVDESCYKKPTCSCGWEGARRRTTNAVRAVFDGSHHVAQDHRLATHVHPTVFDWTKCRSGCTCGWEGPWYLRADPHAGHYAKDDGQEHRRLVLEVAWGSGRESDGVE